MAKGSPEIYVPSSSLVSAMAYDEDESVMVVFFDSGAVYGYTDVTSDEWKGLIGAPSIGAKLNAFFRGNAGKRLEGEEVSGWSVVVKAEVSIVMEQFND